MSPTAPAHKPPAPPSPGRDRPAARRAALLAGLVAAVAGGIVWGLISKYTDYEVGVVAWGIGFVAGFAVERAAGSRRSPDLQRSRFRSALLGVLSAVPQHRLRGAESDNALDTQTGLLSREMFSLFRENLSEVFSLFDLLWTALAVASAWYALKPEENEDAEAPAPAPTVTSLPESFQPSRSAAVRAGTRSVRQPGRPAHASAAARLADHDRLGRHDRRCDRDRARDQGLGRQPLPDPVLSMEPTLHCARAGEGCVARFSDRVLANRFIYRFRDPARGEIIVFETPPAARPRCGAGGTFVKRLIGLLASASTAQRAGPASSSSTGRLDEPYIKPNRRDTRGPSVRRPRKGSTS